MERNGFVRCGDDGRMCPIYTPSRNIHRNIMNFHPNPNLFFLFAFFRFVFVFDDYYVTTHDERSLASIWRMNEGNKNAKMTHKRTLDRSMVYRIPYTLPLYMWQVFTIARLHELNTRLNRNESFAHHYDNMFHARCYVSSGIEPSNMQYW